MCSIVWYNNKEIETVKELKETFARIKLIASYGYININEEQCLCQIGDKMNENEKPEIDRTFSAVNVEPLVRRKVVDWISYDDIGGREEAISGMGGFFDFNEKGMRWKDYIEIWKDEVKPYAEAIRESVLQRGSLLTGSEHQSSANGVPLFDDGKIGSFSYRAWGDLMAAIWSEKENKDYNYMDFYM